MLNTPPFEIKQGAIYKLSISIQDNWWCKNGNIKRKDIQNLDKLLIDAMFEKFGADDCQVFTTFIDKIPKGGVYDESIKPHTYIELEELKAQADLKEKRGKKLKV